MLVFQPIKSKTKTNRHLTGHFPVLGTGWTFSRAWHWLDIFPRLAWLDIFPRLASVACFPAHAHWCRLHAFPRLALVGHFPALGIGCMFSRAWSWCQLHIFPRLVPVAFFFLSLAPFQVFEADVILKWALNL